jgi:NitT/TauT family transport system ATP-binding protein
MNIDLININKSFDGEQVINNFNGIIEENKITCIMGESGIGKTTLINMILGLEKPDSGKILGLDQRKISAVFQEDRLCEEFNCIQNLRIVCDRNISDKELTRLLYALELGEVMYKKVSLLSGGMKRRLAIGRALIFDADIIVMDEPFKGLDRELHAKIIELVKKKAKGKILIVVTHNMEEVKSLNANLIVL